jgi:hypothetical protein
VPEDRSSAAIAAGRSYDDLYPIEDLVEKPRRRKRRPTSRSPRGTPSARVSITSRERPRERMAKINHALRLMCRLRHVMAAYLMACDTTWNKLDFKTNVLYGLGREDGTDVSKVPRLSG